MTDVAAPQWFPSDVQRQRDAWRARRTRRSAALAAVSTLVLVGVVVLVVGSSPGWPRVRDTFFSGSNFARAFPSVLDGLWLNVRIMVISEIAILVFALAIALVRTLPGPVFFPLRLLATVYVDVFRGLPLILVLLLVGYGIPALQLTGLPTSPVVLGSISLILTYTAYVAEVLRAGIESVHPSQRAAARALGLSSWQATRHVVLPQAVRRVMPPLLNDLVSLQKDSGLVSVLGVVDAVYAARIYTAEDFNYTSYVVAGLLFLALTVPLTRFTDWVGRRQGWQGAGGNRV